MTKLIVVILIIFSACGSSPSALAAEEKELKFITKVTSYSTFVLPAFTTVQTFKDSSNSFSSRDKKVLLDAQGDAALFVGTDGATRGVMLESALEVLRGKGLNHTDMALATWLISYPVSSPTEDSDGASPFGGTS